MKPYQKVAFSSGSHGLDSLVNKIQAMPKQRIAAPMRSQGAPQQAALDQCLDAVTRVTNISPGSPGGAHLDEALVIVWGVYEWMQRWVLDHPIVAKSASTKTLSYQEYLEEKGKI